MALKVRGAWIAAGVGGFGLVITALVLARGGGFYIVVPRLAYVLPLAAIGVITALADWGVARASLNAVVWLGAVAMAGAAWNVLVYSLRFGSGVWGLLLPLAHPTGIDFRDGLYEPARLFSNVHSGWPPLTLLLGRPFTLVSFSTAYVVQVGILVALALAAVFLSARLAMRAVCRPDLSGQGLKVTAPQIALVMGFWLFTSYGFMYEVERGNIDLYALFFSLLAVWSMIRLPKSPWLPATVLAVAIGLKLYPAVLLALLFWRYRWRALLPAVVTNAVVLLIAGPANVRDFAGTLYGLQGDPRALWWGNHSAAALANVLRGLGGWAPSWIGYPLLVVPVAVWVCTLVVLVRRGWSARGAVLAAAASVPLMGIVPAISHDYKLVLCVFPLSVLAAVVATMRRRPDAVWVVLFGVLGFAMVFLARSSILIAPSLQSSKYALLVVLQLLLLAVVLLTGCAEAERVPAEVSR
jgi:hypothetical protein